MNERSIGEGPKPHFLKTKPANNTRAYRSRRFSARDVLNPLSQEIIIRSN